ncbi:MAG: Crp/Fnr family transcriptional regulator [Crocinitomicaceae bacterium]
MEIEEEKYILELRKTFNRYSGISEETWFRILSIISFKSVKKGEIILKTGQVAKNVHFICKGVVRTFFSDDKGNIYSKNIFLENSFPASKVSLLLNTPSNFSIEALEDSILIGFNFKAYKKLINEHEDLKNFYISYIEQSWIIEKEQKEVSLVMENASERYLKLLKKHPTIEKRIAQHHIASHLGITPTQLSRIRKTLKK